MEYRIVKRGAEFQVFRVVEQGLMFLFRTENSCEAVEIVLKDAQEQYNDAEPTISFEIKDNVAGWRETVDEFKKCACCE